MSDRLAALDAFLDDEPGAHDSAVRVGAIFERHQDALRDVTLVSAPADAVSDRDDTGTTHGPRVVFRFGIGAGAGERWNWPIDGQDGIEAFREILTRAGVEFEEVVGQSVVAAAEREIVTLDAALEMLAIVDDYDAGNGPEQCVHTYRQGPAGMLLGAHWPLEKARTEIAERGVELAGPVMTGMRHGLVLEDETGAVFFATKDAEA